MKSLCLLIKEERDEEVYVVFRYTLQKTRHRRFLCRDQTTRSRSPSVQKHLRATNELVLRRAHPKVQRLLRWKMSCADVCVFMGSSATWRWYPSVYGPHVAALEASLAAALLLYPAIFQSCTACISAAADQCIVWCDLEDTWRFGFAHPGCCVTCVVCPFVRLSLTQQFWDSEEPCFRARPAMGLVGGVALAEEWRVAFLDDCWHCGSLSRVPQKVRDSATFVTESWSGGMKSRLMCITKLSGRMSKPSTHCFAIFWIWHWQALCLPWQTLFLIYMFRVARFRLCNRFRNGRVKGKERRRWRSGADERARCIGIDAP